MVIHLLISFILRGGGNRIHGTMFPMWWMSQLNIFAQVGKALTNVPNFKFVPYEDILYQIKPSNNNETRTSQSRGFQFMYGIIQKKFWRERLYKKNKLGLAGENGLNVFWFVYFCSLSFR